MSLLTTPRAAGSSRPRKQAAEQPRGSAGQPASLSAAIRQLARRKGLYLKDVAQRAGAGPSGITRIVDSADTGHVLLATLRRVATALEARLEVRFVDPLDEPRPGPSGKPAGLGASIRQLARKRGLYLMEVGRRAGTTSSGMTRILGVADTDRVTVATLMRIATALEASLEMRLVDLRPPAAPQPWSSPPRLLTHKRRGA